MDKVQIKNRFAAAAEDDSDDDLATQKQTKTQKKKEERKVPAAEKVVKVNSSKMAEGGFDVVNNERKTDGQRGGRGGRGGARGGERGGFAGRGRGGPRLDADGNPIKYAPRLDAEGNPVKFAPRPPRLDEDGNPIKFEPRQPRQPRLDAEGNPVKYEPRPPRLDEDGNPIKFAPRPPRLDAEGNPIKFAPRPQRLDADGNPVKYQPRLDADGNPIRSERRERQPFRGKPREEGHPFDRQSGAGRGRRPVEKKDGAGKFSEGYKPDVAYKKKTDEGEDGEEVPAEEEKVNRAPVVTETIIEEVIGVSLEDFFKTRAVVGKKEARKAEGVQGKKVTQHEPTKENQSTQLKTNYGGQTSVT
jgi:hypothetical protein